MKEKNLMGKLKKTSILIIVLCLVLIIALCSILIFIKKDSNTGGNVADPSNTVTQIALNSEQYINSLEKIDIVNTNDSIMITKKVKWKVPEHDGATTTSFAILIPYTFTVDGVNYDGVYELGDYTPDTIDNNPKYKLTISDLTSDGKIRILIKRK